VIVPESWRFLRLTAGYCKQFPHAKRARKKNFSMKKAGEIRLWSFRLMCFVIRDAGFSLARGQRLNSVAVVLRHVLILEALYIVYIDITLIVHWYYIDSTLIVHWYCIDITLILHLYYIDFTLILHWSVVRTTYHADLFYSHVEVSLWHVLLGSIWIHRKRYIHTLWQPIGCYWTPPFAKTVVLDA
jgi:hypothetical protein